MKGAESQDGDAGPKGAGIEMVETTGEVKAEDVNNKNNLGSKNLGSEEYC